MQFDTVAIPALSLGVIAVSARTFSDKIQRLRSDCVRLSVNSRAVSRAQPSNKIGDFRTDDVSVPSSGAHQATKTLRDKNSIRAEVKKVVRDLDIFSA